MLIFSLTLLLGFAGFIVSQHGDWLADRLCKLTFHAVSLGMPQDAKAAWRDEALNHMVAKVGKDLSRHRSKTVILWHAALECLALLVSAIGERAFYITSTGPESGSPGKSQQAIAFIRRHGPFLAGGATGVGFAAAWVAQFAGTLVGLLAGLTIGITALALGLALKLANMAKRV